MGWAYLVVSINGAAYTLNAYRPARRSRVLYGWSFFASWVTGSTSVTSNERSG